MDKEKRFARFAENLEQIAVHNKLAEQGNFTYRLGLNKYSDLVRHASQILSA